MAIFPLSADRDVINGSGSDDRIVGGTNTLQTVDNIDGGGGLDILRANVDSNGVQSPTISNTERLFLDTSGMPIRLSNVTGAEQINTQGASIVFEDVSQANLSARFGAFAVESGTVNLRFRDGALESMTDTLRLRSDASNVTFTSDSVFDSTMDGEQNRTEDAARVERLDILLTGTRDAAQFDNQVDVSDFSGAERLTLSGGAKSKITIDSTELELIDASQTTGGVTVTSDIAGDQRVFGGTGDDDFKTGGGDDTIVTDRGDDVIDAGAGDNLIRSGPGDDEITAEAGNDTIVSGRGNDRIDSGSGEDRIVSGDGADRIFAGDQQDVISSGRGDDVVRGGGGDDVIFDDAGADTYFGQGDDDRFIAGAGNDTFDGGGGQDRFIFDRGAFGTDTVENFQLSSTPSNNDLVVFEYQGERTVLRSRNDFEIFQAENPNGITVDQATDTITLDADDGTIILEASSTDFLMA